MPGAESKMAEPEDDKGKQPAVESDGEESEGAPDDAGADPAAAGSSTAVAKKKKKKKSKKAGPNISKAVESLTDKQVQDLLAHNPSLTEELRSQAGASGKGESGLVEMLKKLDMGQIMTGMSSGGKNAKDMASYKFWSSQPVPQFGEMDAKPDGPLQEKKVEDVPTEPLPLLTGFEWDTMDIEVEEQMKEVYELLNGHYVEDSAAQFRFDYSTWLLKW